MLAKLINATTNQTNYISVLDNKTNNEDMIEKDSA